MTAHDREEAVKALAEAFLYTEEGGPDNTGYRRGDMVSGFAGDLFRKWAERALTDLDANPTARAALARYLATGDVPGDLRAALADGTLLRAAIDDVSPLTDPRLHEIEWDDVARALADRLAGTTQDTATPGLREALRAEIAKVYEAQKWGIGVLHDVYKAVDTALAATQDTAAPGLRERFIAELTGPGAPVEWRDDRLPRIKTQEAIAAFDRALATHCDDGWCDGFYENDGGRR